MEGAGGGLDLTPLPSPGNVKKPSLNRVKPEKTSITFCALRDTDKNKISLVLYNAPDFLLFRINKKVRLVIANRSM